MTCGIVLGTILQQRKGEKLFKWKTAIKLGVKAEKKCRGKYPNSANWQARLRDAIDDGAHGEAERAARTVVIHLRKVGDRVEVDGLIARVVARHVALAAVDARVLEMHTE